MKLTSRIVPDRSPSRHKAATVAATTDLRFYWNPRGRWILGGFLAFAVAAFVLIYTTGHPRPDWLGAVILAGFVALVLSGLWSLRTSGVRETPTGISWHGGLRGQSSFSGEAAWTDMRGFGYAQRALVGPPTVVVDLADGTRKTVWTTAPVMRWNGGSCYDFAALLTERARTFGAPIEKYHALGLTD